MTMHGIQDVQSTPPLSPLTSATLCPTFIDSIRGFGDGGKNVGFKPVSPVLLPKNLVSSKTKIPVVPTKPKRRRRSNEELAILKNIPCTYPLCNKVYASISALTTHLRLKHRNHLASIVGSSSKKLERRTVNMFAPLNFHTNKFAKITTTRRGKNTNDDHNNALVENSHQFLERLLYINNDNLMAVKIPKSVTGDADDAGIIVDSGNGNIKRRHRTMSLSECTLSSQIPSLLQQVSTEDRDGLNVKDDSSLISTQSIDTMQDVASFMNPWDFSDTFLRTISDALNTNQQRDHDAFRSTSLTNLNLL